MTDKGRWKGRSGDRKRREKALLVLLVTVTTYFHFS